MSFFDYFRASKPRSANVAKERLQIIVAHERHARASGHLDFLPMLQRDLLNVIRKYFPIEEEQLKVNIDREGDCEILELNIALGENAEKPASTTVR